MCGLEAALARADGAGERALHVPEQLGLEQRLGHRAAVERDELLVLARRVLVDRARHQFLARAGLAQHQDRARGRRHRLEQRPELAHRRAAADEPLEPVAAIELLAQVLVLGAQVASLERGAQHVEQLVELERLGDEVGGAEPDRRDGILHRSVPGHEDDDDVGVPLEGGIEDVGARSAWQPEVGDDRVVGEVRQALEGDVARVGFVDEEPFVAQPQRGGRAKRGLVFHEQEMFRTFKHLRSRVGILTHLGRGDPAAAGPVTLQVCRIRVRYTLRTLMW